MSTNAPLSFLQDRIEKSSKIIEPFLKDEKLCAGRFAGRSFHEIKQALIKLGVDGSDVGKSLLEEGWISFEEFEKQYREEFKEYAPSDWDDYPPLARLKMVWSILTNEKLKKSIEPTAENTSFPGISAEFIKAVKPIPQWSNNELLAEYSKDGSFAVHDELIKRSKGRYVVIFNEDNSLDVENTLNLLRKSQYQDTPQLYKIDGELKEVYRIGDFPLLLFFECPIHKDVILLDGYCDKCVSHWDVENTEHNVFFRMVFESNNVDFRLYKDKSLPELKSLFPQVWLQYKSLAEEGTLPSLKRKLSKPKQGDPFRVVGTNKTF